MTDLAAPPRSAVPVDRTWDAASVFATASDWEAALEAIVADLPRLAAFAGRLAEGSSVTAEALATRDDLMRRLGHVVVYASLGYAVETSDQDAVARFGRAQAVVAQAEGAASFIEPELLELGHDRIREWSEDDARFEQYRHYFDDLFRRGEHVRSSEVEELLGLLADAQSGPYAIYSSLADTDLEFAAAVGAAGEKAEVTQGTIYGLLGSPDRALRRSAWESYADGYRGVRSAFAATYATAIKQDVFTSRARRHASTCAAALHSSNIPLEVFDNLLATFERHLSTWHRYWRVRAELLGLDSIRTYDMWAPWAASHRSSGTSSASSGSPSRSPRSATSTSRRCAGGVSRSAGSTSIRIRGRWVARSPPARRVRDPFIVMSFDGTATSLGTLAHELGHSMHSYLAWEAQPQVSSRYSLFVAEVASNFHQVLLRAHLLETSADRELQLAVLDEAMANFHRYFFLMPTLARFEREIHERVEQGEGLTADLLDERMADLFAEAYGPDIEVDRERDGITWAQFAHLYAPFYVYQYATGISGAHALARGVLAGESGAAERYLDFLRAGGSRYALDILRDAGVDLTSSEPVEETFAVLASLVDRLEALSTTP